LRLVNPVNRPVTPELTKQLVDPVEKPVIDLRAAAFAICYFAIRRAYTGPMLRLRKRHQFAAVQFLSGLLRTRRRRL